MVKTVKMVKNGGPGLKRARRTGPERLKGAKEEVKTPEGPPAKSRALEGPLDF